MLVDAANERLLPVDVEGAIRDEVRSVGAGVGVDVVLRLCDQPVALRLEAADVRQLPRFDATGVHLAGVSAEWARRPSSVGGRRRRLTAAAPVPILPRLRRGFQAVVSVRQRCRGWCWWRRTCWRSGRRFVRRLRSRLVRERHRWLLRLWCGVHLCRRMRMRWSSCWKHLLRARETLNCRRAEHKYMTMLHSQISLTASASLITALSCAVPPIKKRNAQY